MEQQGPRGDLAYGLVIGALYVVVVGVQVFVVVDELTGGQLSADLARRWKVATARWAARRRLEATVAAEAPWVIWDATETAREAASDND